MRVPSEQHAVQKVVERLAELLGVDCNPIHFGPTDRLAEADGIIKAGPFTFIVEWKGSGSATSVARAIDQVQRYTSDSKFDAIPLVAVPFMGESGRHQCAKAKVSWLDLSGNAFIFGLGLHILVEGKSNIYKPRGRPSTAFAPMGSRITRWLLMHPTQSFTQREIAKATKTDEGYTSKIVKKLEGDGLIIRNNNGALAPRDPKLLLNAWGEIYNFSKHQLIRGHVPERTGDALLRRLTEKLKDFSAPYAATGLSGAWLIDRFAGFRIVTLYLEREPSQDMLSALSFREDDRGSNVWLVIPNDAGVFHGASIRDGIRAVHPVQIYLDLQAHPERAKEAATRLRNKHLNWKIDG